MHKILAVMMAATLATACSSSGGDGDAQTWTAPCVDGAATHDFGTTDLGVLGRVVALQTVEKNEVDPGVPDDAGTVVKQVPLYFDGSIGDAECISTSAVTFVLEP